MISDRIRDTLRPIAIQIATLLWREFGVTHDPRVFRCKVCGIDQRREHDWMTLGHAARLCSECWRRRNNA